MGPHSLGVQSPTEQLNAPQSGPCKSAARLPVPWLLKARVESDSCLRSQTALLAPSGAEEEAGWNTVLHEWGLGCVKGG